MRVMRPMSSSPTSRSGQHGRSGSNHVASCGSQAASSEVAYVFRAPAAGPVCITTAQSEFDTVLHVREAACADGVEVACNDDDGAAFGIAQAQNSTIELNAVQNTAYYIFVDGYGRNSSGNYVLEVRGNACDAPWGEGPTDCLAPRQIAPGQVVVGHTTDGDDNYQGLRRRRPGVRVPLSVPFAGRLCASTVGSDFDTVLYVRDGQCADGMELSCNDDIAFGNTRSQVAFDAAANTDYFLFVDAFANGGNFQLELTEGDCP